MLKKIYVFHIPILDNHTLESPSMQIKDSW